MQFFTLTSALSFSALALAGVVQQRATTTALGQMYAYGTNITGFPVFVADGTAYIGNVSLSTIDGAANVTFAMVDDEIIVHKHFDNGTTLTNETQYFAIDTTSGATNPVLIDTSVDESGYTTDGYFIYGTQITYLSSARQIESNFYAVESDTTGIYELYWDADTSAATGGTVVVLKAIAPPSVGRPGTTTTDDSS